MNKVMNAARMLRTRSDNFLGKGDRFLDSLHGFGTRRVAHNVERGSRSKGCGFDIARRAGGPLVHGSGERASAIERRFLTFQEKLNRGAERPFVPIPGFRQALFASGCQPR
jgi:hypothetical protein